MGGDMVAVIMAFILLGLYILSSMAAEVPHLIWGLPIIPEDVEPLSEEEDGPPPTTGLCDDSNPPAYQDVVNL